MTNNTFPYLCGGVFFFLLSQTKPPKRTAREHMSVLKDEHSNPIVMEDLIYAIIGARGYGASKDTSRFCGCLSNGSVNVPFNDRSVCDSLDNEVKNKYPAVLERMTEFVGWHIAANKSEWLVKAVLEIIQDDNGILDTDLFYVQPNGIPISKTDMLNAHEFWLPAFLVGVIHYIEMNRSDKNENGFQTLEALGIQKPHKERIYSGNLGAKITGSITVHRKYETPDKCDVSPEQKSEKTPIDEIYNEAKTADDEVSSGIAEEDKKITVIQHQTNVIQNGENNVNLTNNGTINFNF